MMSLRRWTVEVSARSTRGTSKLLTLITIEGCVCNSGVSPGLWPKSGRAAHEKKAFAFAKKSGSDVCSVGAKLMMGYPIYLIEKSDVRAAVSRERNSPLDSGGRREAGDEALRDASRRDVISVITTVKHRY